jgi:LuxR family maltose regulon positive regulatory protein
MLGTVYLNKGEVNKALALLIQLRALPQLNNDLVTKLGLVVGQAEIYAWQGQLKEAASKYKEFIRLAQGSWVNPVLVYVRLAHIYWEWHERQVAFDYLKQVEELTQVGGYKPGQASLSNLWPTTLRDSKDSGEADQDKSHFYLQIESLRSRLQSSVSATPVEFAEANWHSKSLVISDATQAYQQEFHFFQLARVLIHQQQFSQAHILLENLYKYAQEQGRTHSLIKILILQTLAYAADTTKKTNSLKVGSSLVTALTLAQPGNYIQTFLDEGPVLENILKTSVVTSSELAAYKTGLLSLFQNQATPLVNTPSPPTPVLVSALASDAAPQVDGLTDRELMVLRLMCEGASNQEIALKLTLALGTVKKHSANIFSKLHVTSRIQAVLQAQELGLV